MVAAASGHRLPNVCSLANIRTAWNVCFGSGLPSLWFGSCFEGAFLQVRHGAFWEASRLSDDEVGLDVVLAFVCVLLRLLYMGAQGRYCGAGQFKARHLNSGQRRDGHFGD